MMEGSSEGRPASMMPFMDAMKSGFSKWNVMSGRSSRSELWWVWLGYFLSAMGLMIVSGVLDLGILMILILPFIPVMICVMVRRLHDLGKSGWWYWICLIPFIGGIWLLYLMVSDGEAGENMYGSVPTNMLE